MEQKTTAKTWENFFRQLWEIYTDKTKKEEIGKENKPELYYFIQLDNFTLAIKKGRRGYRIIGHNVRARLKPFFKEKRTIIELAENWEVWAEKRSLNEAVEEFFVLLNEIEL